MDRRVAKTQKALIEALQHCLTRHAWEDISVQLLCDTADISRSTFYAHFDGKQALLTAGMQWISSHLVADDHGGRSLDLNRKLKILPALLRHMRGHLFLFETTRSSMPGRELSYQFEQTIGKLIQLEVSNSRYAKSISADQSIFLLGGLFAMLDDWRMKGCDVPDDAMIQRLDRLAEQVLNLAH